VSPFQGSGVALLRFLGFPLACGELHPGLLSVAPSEARPQLQVRRARQVAVWRGWWLRVPLMRQWLRDQVTRRHITSVRRA
jgi:hypothetical protein